MLPTVIGLLKKSKSLNHYVSASESPVKISPAHSEISRHKQTDKQTFKNNNNISTYGLNFNMNLVKN